VHIVDPALAERLLATYGYAAIFAMVMLESAGIPLPGETVLISASICRNHESPGHSFGDRSRRCRRHSR
jgi:membrane protein DedA with SNARE-associated domain